ncbi:hypothetical protein T484DRAFT_1825070, partial [Baffinella frigidus]
DAAQAEAPEEHEPRWRAAYRLSLERAEQDGGGSPASAALRTSSRRSPTIDGLYGRGGVNAPIALALSPLPGRRGSPALGNARVTGHADAEANCPRASLTRSREARRKSLNEDDAPGDSQDPDTPEHRRRTSIGGQAEHRRRTSPGGELTRRASPGGEVELGRRGSRLSSRGSSRDKHREKVAGARRERGVSEGREDLRTPRLARGNSERTVNSKSEADEAVAATEKKLGLTGYYKVPPSIG